MTDTLPIPVTAALTTSQKAMLLNLVARAANAEIMPRFRKLDAGEIDTKSGPNDLVTAADCAAEAMITRALQTAFPHAVIIGEESAADTPDYREKLDAAELGFTIDPVDGTWNFAHGLPVFGTMVAACRFGRPVFGMIYDPVGRDVIWADIEAPATFLPATGGAKPIATAKPKPLGDLTGYVELSFMSAPHREIAARQCLDLQHFGTLRCSAHHYRLLATGAVDFILASGLSPWDHAPGVMITVAAGGHSAMLDGRAYTTAITDGYLLSAANADTWETLRTHFAALLD